LTGRSGSLRQTALSTGNVTIIDSQHPEPGGFDNLERTMSWEIAQPAARLTRPRRSCPNVAFSKAQRSGPSAGGRVDAGARCEGVPVLQNLAIPCELGDLWGWVAA